MTKVEIYPGACGLSVIVTATEADRKKIRLTIETDCEHVKKLSDKLEFLTVKDIYGRPFGEDKVYQAAKEAIRHAGCPVPCGIIKTAEAEFGLAVRRNVLIHFTN
jgi:hypothetical protein